MRGGSSAPTLLITGTESRGDRERRACPRVSPAMQTVVTPVTVAALLARNQFRLCQSSRRAAIPLPDLDDPFRSSRTRRRLQRLGGIGAGLHRYRRAAVKDWTARCEPQSVITWLHAVSTTSWSL
jgi:hypothetical protein